MKRVQNYLLAGLLSVEELQEAQKTKKKSKKKTSELVYVPIRVDLVTENSFYIYHHLRVVPEQ